MPSIQLFAPGPVLDDPRAHASLPHVLFVIDGFPRALGGGERVVLRLAALLPKYGYRASILTFRIHPESAFRAAEAPCPVYLLPLTNAFGLQSVSSAIAFLRFLKAERVQVVQTFFESSDLWAGLVTRLSSRVKLVWSRRDMGILRGPKHRRAYRAMRRLPHAVSAVSRKVAEHVISEDHVPASRVHVVHNGLDLDLSAFPLERDLTSHPVITTTGNIRRVKGHDLLIRAMPAILAEFPDARCTIAGEVLETDFFAELQQLAHELGVAEHLDFLGKVTDLQAHLSPATVFALPSRSEGFSNALIEAMGAGLPCVATDVGGNAEAIDDGANGLIIPAEDVPALAHAILRILRDDAFARRLSVAGRHTFETLFTSDAMLRKVTGIYGSVLSVTHESH